MGDGYPIPDDPELSAFMGIGHFPSQIAIRKVHAGEYPYEPATCRVEQARTKWIKADTHLVCTGCGLDVT